MNFQTIVMCVVALILGMLLAHMLKSVCGCKLVEGQGGYQEGTDGVGKCVPTAGTPDIVRTHMESGAGYEYCKLYDGEWIVDT